MREALKLALEALTYLLKPMAKGWNAETQTHKRDAAITAIKAALAAQPTGKAPCERHCEANAFQIAIRNLKGDIERMKAAQREPDELTIAYMSGLYDGKKHAAQRQWAGLTSQDWNVVSFTAEFRAGAEWANNKLKEKNV